MLVRYSAGRPNNKSVGSRSHRTATDYVGGLGPALVNISTSAPPKSELLAMLRTTDVGTSPPLDWQASTQSAGWSARARRERTQRREHVAARCLRRLLHYKLVVMVRDGTVRRKGVCACTRACSSVASFASGYTIRVFWSNNPHATNSKLSHPSNPH